MGRSWARRWAYLTLIAGVINGGCTLGTDSSLGEIVEGGDCEGAARQIVQGDSGANAVLNGTKQVSGTVASYGVAAAGYTADVVVTGTVGIVAFTVFCPVFVAEIAACAVGSGHCGGGGGNIGCFADPFAHAPSAKEKKAKGDGPTIGPGLGSKALAGTEGWREDSGSMTLVHQIRAVAACYEHRDSKGDLIKASLQLQQIHESHLYDRINSRERSLVDEDVVRVKARLNVVDPGYQEELDRKNRELVQAILTQQKPSLWRDLDTGSMWRFQPATVKDGAQAQTVCSGASATRNQLWQLPSRADAVNAVKHGLVDPQKNSAFGEARAHHGRAFVRDGDSFATVDLSTGEITGRADAENLSLLCVQ